MGLEKAGLRLGKKIIAWTTRTSGRKGLLATKPMEVNIEGLKLPPKLKNDVVQISGTRACIPENVTNMASGISNEFGNINRALSKATDLNEFKRLSLEINSLANSSERDILMQKFLSRFKVFKDPINGVRNNFSQVFGRQLSDQEFTQLCQRYKNIFEEQDNLSFLSKLYSQIMRDFRINPHKLRFELSSTHPLNIADITKEGHILHLYVGDGACLSNPENRIKAMNAICHELTHVRQNMIAYGTSPEAYVEAIARYSLKKGNYQGKSLEEVKEIIRTNIQQGVLVDSARISLNSEMGQRGVKYINGNLKYKSFSDNPLEYYEQLIEKEAFEAGDMAEQSIRFILAGLL